MRLFLGIYPTKDYLDYCRDVIRKFNKEKRNLQVMPLDQVHITMRFIGPKVGERSKDILLNEFKLHEGNYGKATIEMNRIQFGFAYQKFPKILLATIKQHDSLNEITDFSHGLIKKLNLDDTITWKVRKKDSYHMTLARLKPTATNKQGKFIGNIVKEIERPELPPIEVSEMYLIESIIQRDFTPIYRKIDKIKL